MVKTSATPNHYTPFTLLAVQDSLRARKTSRRRKGIQLETQFGEPNKSISRVSFNTSSNKGAAGSVHSGCPMLCTGSPTLRSAPSDSASGTPVKYPGWADHSSQIPPWSTERRMDTSSHQDATHHPDTDTFTAPVADLAVKWHESKPKYIRSSWIRHSQLSRINIMLPYLACTVVKSE